MADMSFVADGNIEPDKPRSTLMTEDNSQEKKGARKRKGTGHDELNIKRSQMYEAAIEFMRQPAPPAMAPVQPPPLTDEDMFGQYVASQLKLLDATSKLRIKAQINNIFFMQQLHEIEAPNPYDNAQPQRYTSLW